MELTESSRQLRGAKESWSEYISELRTELTVGYAGESIRHHGKGIAQKPYLVRRVV